MTIATASEVLLCTFRLHDSGKSDVQVYVRGLSSLTAPSFCSSNCSRW